MKKRVAVGLVVAGAGVVEAQTNGTPGGDHQGQQTQEKQVMASEQVATGQAGKRTAELSIEVKASADAVWKCLTDADELTKWFPMEARVKPGVGGSIWCSWGEGMQWEQAITIWEPKRRLRTLWCPPNTPEADLFGVDFFVEDKGGGVTRLRLVHFGFSKDAQWDTMYDGVSRGWDSMLWGMRTYLEKHAGEVRDVMYLKGGLGERTKAQVWTRAFSQEGVLPEPALSGLKPGDRFNVTVGGEQLKGVVRVNLPDKDWQGVVENMGSALLRVQMDPCHGGPGEEFTLSLSSFGVDHGRLDALRNAWTGRLGGMVEKVQDRTVKK